MTTMTMSIQAFEVLSDESEEIMGPYCKTIDTEAMADHLVRAEWFCPKKTYSICFLGCGSAASEVDFLQRLLRKGIKVQ